LGNIQGAFLAAAGKDDQRERYNRFVHINYPIRPVTTIHTERGRELNDGAV
jgi:hypothetical protein